MFIGHYAVGLAAKKWAPETSLGKLFFGCQFLDLIWPVLVLAGIEQVGVDPSATAFNPLDFIHYPYSHSLGMALIWSVVIGLGLRSLVVGGLVFSHWILDWFTHRPDLPLFLGDTPKFGLGLWNFPMATNIVEAGLFALGLFLYRAELGKDSRKPTWSFWGLMAFLVLIALGNALGPKPEVGTPAAAIAGPALAMWLLVAWAFQADKKWEKKT